MAVTPTRGSPIGAVSVGTTDDFFTDDFQKRLSRLSTAGLRTTPQSQVIDKDGNVIGTVADFTPPPTTLDKVMALGLRSGGISDALSPLGDAIMGRSSNLGIPPLSPMTSDRDTIGGELLQGLGNIGLAGLEGLRRTAETVSEVPFALGRGLGTESESAYMRRMRQLASDPRRPGEGVPDFVGGSLQPDIDIDDPRSPIAFGPSYQQTPTDVDQDAAIRSQIRPAQDITEEQGIFGDITDDGRRPGMGVPDFVGGVPSAREEIAQAIAASEADVGDFTESGRRKDPTAGDDTDETTPLKQTDGSDVEGADNSVKQSTVAAINDVLRQVKPDAKPKDYDDYMKEFADLTGLDVSGQPDNSQALMAFGLALMQNKAGKGFNVGRMLSEVGAAGEKAMPALAAARKEAKQTRIKAAEFAISRKEKDQAKALNKDFYYVVPKGGKGFVSNFDRGELKRFNSQELFDLDQNKEFQDQFEIIPMSTYEKVSAALMKEPEYGNKYANSYASISLFQDAPEDFQISVQRTDGNYKGPDAPELGRFNKAEYETYAKRLKDMDDGLNNFAGRIGEAYSLVQSDQVNTLDQIGDAAVDLGNALGLKFTDDMSPSAKVKRILNVIAAEKAPEILGEAGKTISDRDRERVQEIAGQLTLTTPPATLKRALKEMYDRVVVKGKRNVTNGITTLNQYAGVKSSTRIATMKDGVLVIQ